MAIERRLGPVVDVGTAMTYNIFFPTVGYVCRGTVRMWTPAEKANASLLMECAFFMVQLNDSIGPDACP